MTEGIRGNTLGRPPLHLTDAEKIERFDNAKKTKLSQRNRVVNITISKENATQLSDAVSLLSNDLGIKLTKSQGLRYILDSWTKQCAVKT